MKEFRTRLVGPKTDNGGKLVQYVSDWEYVEFWDDNGNFLECGLEQVMPYMGTFVGETKPTMGDYFGPTAPGLVRNIDFLYIGQLQVDDIDRPCQSGRDPLTGYYPPNW